MADTKNWTWVLERACPECGFEAGNLPRDEIGDAARGAAARFVTFLGGDGGDVRARPAPEVWSILEYACHERDVCRIMATRLGLILGADGAEFPNWDQDATAVDDRYDEQDPTVVADELAAAAATVAGAFDAVRDDQWSCTGRRSDGSTFTAESLGRYMVHDLVHHVWDVEAATADA